jgi:hypothetical protein
MSWGEKMQWKRRQAFLIGQVDIVPPPTLACLPLFFRVNTTLLLGIHTVTPTLTATGGFAYQSQWFPSYSPQSLNFSVFDLLKKFEISNKCRSTS